MTREVPYDEDEVCDRCGAAGAFDFMGDVVLCCPACARRLVEREDISDPFHGTNLASKVAAQDPEET